MYTFDQINDATGFANGDTFTSEYQVREFFTQANIEQTLGQTIDQDVLDDMADRVIANEWHCEFLTYDVVFNNNGESFSKGFRESLYYCCNWINDMRSSDQSFQDFAGGMVEIYCNERPEKPVYGLPI